jgi:hypothetical protein
MAQVVQRVQGNSRPGIGVIEWDAGAAPAGCAAPRAPDAPGPPSGQGGGCGGGALAASLRQCWLPRNFTLLALHSAIAAVAAGTEPARHAACPISTG